MADSSELHTIIRQWADGFSKVTNGRPSLYAFVGTCGLPFVKRPHSYAPGRQYKRKMCFANAYKMADNSKGRLVYVEGYVAIATAPIPIQHAWCARPGSLEVVDPTTDNGSYYVGIPFTIEYVKQVHEESNDATVIDNWESGFPLLSMTGEQLRQCIHSDWHSDYPQTHPIWS